MQRISVVSTLFVTLATTILPAARALAQPFLVDQESIGLPFGGFGLSVETGNTIGQEFTPAFSALDVVDIGLGPHDSSSLGLRVNIRAGSIDGPIIGTSLQAIVQGMPPMQPYFHFDFASPVPLVPGNLYVIQPILVQPTAQVGLPFLDPGPYAGGRAIVFGEVRPDLDMIFRTGLTVPEPSALMLAGSIVGWILSAPRRYSRCRLFGGRTTTHCKRNPDEEISGWPKDCDQFATLGPNGTRLLKLTQGQRFGELATAEKGWADAICWLKLQLSAGDLR